LKQRQQHVSIVTTPVITAVLNAERYLVLFTNFLLFYILERDDSGPVFNPGRNYCRTLLLVHKIIGLNFGSKSFCHFREMPEKYIQ